MNNKEKFQTVLIFLFVLVLLFVAVSLSAQTRPYMVTIKTDKASGKEIETRKDCVSVSVSDNDIIFIINGTTYQAFQRDGVDKYGKPAWEDLATGKRVGVHPQEDGRVCIIKTDKKYFCYTPTTKKQVQ